MKRFAVLAFAALVTGCGMQEPKIDTNAHAQEVREWQKNRDTRLRKEDSWLTLIGLHWLTDGENTVTLTKASAPQLRLLRSGTSTVLHATEPMTVDGKPVTGDVPLRADADEGGPTIVQMGSVRFNVIKRGERYGLRVKDAEAETRTGFKGLEYYPIDPKWRVTARFEAYHPPKKIPITDVTGMTADNISPGSLAFEIDGKEYRLDPIIEEGSDEYFIIFRDATSADTTYPAGRYLYAPQAKDGKTVIDFNKAYNPPCAFTPYATCPLPPMQNRLPVRIEAGEKKYGDH
ncbi:MAG TPA: DUF1684 domain-containing protein [Thermoanaerobaculia bacterium]|nr:DUF1684 domain-containing protein [Thermoanaerobaculia bacterium]